VKPGDTARVIRGPWSGFVGKVTATFTGGWVAVRVTDHLHPRTFPATELTDAALDRAHRIVTTHEHGSTRNYCLDCGATRSGVHPPQPPCKGES
jgi:hypothetical protein